jgi:hypothetical protein
MPLICARTKRNIFGYAAGHGPWKLARRANQSRNILIVAAKF